MDMDELSWYGVRCVFRHRPLEVYEERVTLWTAGSFDEAISQAESLRRVSVRPGHFYPPSLVASQFEALQDPSAEAGVLTLDGDEALEVLASRAAVWLSGAGR